MRRTIERVCAAAGVDGHPHRFRDTFAVRLREKGVHMDQVSILLGHTSVKTTEKYYAPWVRSRQRLLDEAVATLFRSGTA
jgi:integrase/recombinase XerD